MSSEHYEIFHYKFYESLHENWQKRLIFVHNRTAQTDKNGKRKKC